jgi:hypothetical protein
MTRPFFAIAPPHTTTHRSVPSRYLFFSSPSRFFLFRHITRVRSFLSREAPPFAVAFCVRTAAGSPGFGHGGGPEMCVLDCLGLPQQDHPAPGRHGTMGVTWQASVTRTTCAVSSLYSIHPLPLFSPTALAQFK